MKLAVFYHAKISGEGIPDEEYALELVMHQMLLLRKVGLESKAEKILLGVNGGSGDALTIASMAHGNATVIAHGEKSRTEIPTLNLLRDWARGKSDWGALYFHTKGVTHPHAASYARWRERMEYACITNWQRCVRDLQSGADAVGCHWLTPEKFRGAVTSPFFGGTFWWSRTEYINQLPALPEPTWKNRYEAESWIGRRRPYPIVVDYNPGWP